MNNSFQIQQFDRNGTDDITSPNFINKSLQNGFIIVDALVLSIFGAFSMASNGFLVYIMLKYKKEFETSYYYLLGVNAICDIIVSSSGLVTALLLAVFGTFYFSYIQCVWYHSFALIAFNMSFVLVFFIAADRLFAVFFPIRYYILNCCITRYVFCLCLIALLIGISLFVYCVISIMMSNNNITFRCSLADLWRAQYILILQPFCLTFTISAVFCYVAIWIQIRFIKKPSTQEEKRRNEINKSLTIILLLIVFGWIFNMAIRSYITRILPQVPERYFVMNISDIVLTFIGIVNIFVLYLCSKDYRRIINKFISTTSSTTRVVSLQDNYVK